MQREICLIHMENIDNLLKIELGGKNFPISRVLLSGTLRKFMIYAGCAASVECGFRDLFYDIPTADFDSRMNLLYENLITILNFHSQNQFQVI